MSEHEREDPSGWEEAECVVRPDGTLVPTDTTLSGRTMDAYEREEARRRVRYQTTGLDRPPVPTKPMEWEALAMDYKHIATNGYLTDRERRGAAMALALIEALLSE